MNRLAFLVFAFALFNSNLSYANNSEDVDLPSINYSTTVIYVKDNAKAVLDFYQLAFGFTLKYYDENMDFGELETKNTSIMISSYEAGKIMMGSAFPLTKENTSVEKGKTLSNSIELAFTTDDVAKAYQHAISLGATSAKEPVTHPWGQTAAYVYSIEGTLIGLLSPPPTQSE